MTNENFYYSGEPGNRTTFTFCTWCNAIITRTYRQARGKKYHACSPECQKKLSSLFQSKEWKKMTDKQRRSVFGAGFKRYSEDWAMYRHNQVVTSLTVAKPSKKAKVERIILKNPENMLQAHYAALQDDPEKLSTAFIENLMGWEVKEVKT